MSSLLAIGVVLFLLAILLGGIWFLSSRDRQTRELKNPPMPSAGWTNTAIRRQGKSGKGIR